MTNALATSQRKFEPHLICYFTMLYYECGQQISTTELQIGSARRKPGPMSRHRTVHVVETGLNKQWLSCMARANEEAFKQNGNILRFQSHFHSNDLVNSGAKVPLGRILFSQLFTGTDVVGCPARNPRCNHQSHAIYNR